MSKVFLGGTCNDSTWRDEMIPLLKIDYFNPVVPDWTPECQLEERRQKKLCDLHLYTITPLMTGFFSIAEVIDSSNKNPSGTILSILTNDGDTVFTRSQIKSLVAVAQMAEINGAHIFVNQPSDLIDYLNSFQVAE